VKWTVGNHCCTGLCIFFQDGSNAISPSVPVGSETLKMKKALGDANTARWLPQTPFPRAQDGQNLIIWRWSLPLPKNPVWWGSMHAISSYRGNRATNTPTNTQTHTHKNHRQDRLQYTASLSLARSVIRSHYCSSLNHSLYTQQHGEDTWPPAHQSQFW